MGERKRLYIGGLPDGIQGQELEKRFSRFGDVTDVDIKVKKDNSDSRTFAYLNISITEANLKKCVQLYNKSKWKGRELHIEIAKENFINRLKKERETTNKFTAPDGRPDGHEAVRTKIVQSVQGTPIDDMRNWVVGKNGSILPVLYLRDQDKQKVRKRDPAPYLHANKTLTDDGRIPDTPVEKLTWHLEERPHKHGRDTAQNTKRRSNVSKDTLGKKDAVQNAPNTNKMKGADKKSRTLKIGRTVEGAVDFISDEGSELGESDTKVYHSSEESSDETHIQKKKQFALKKQMQSNDSSEDTDDILSNQKSQTTLRRKKRKSSKKKGSVKEHSSDSDSVLHTEAPETILPGWLESESESDRGDDHKLESGGNTCDQLDTISAAHGKFSAARDNRGCVESLGQSGTEQSSLSEDDSRKPIQAPLREGHLDEESSTDGEHSSEGESPVSLESLSEDGDSLQSDDSPDSSFQRVPSPEKRANILSLLTNKQSSQSSRDPYTRAVLDEYSSGTSKCNDHSNVDEDSDPDVFEMIAAGNIGQLYESVHKTSSNSVKSQLPVETGKGKAASKNIHVSTNELVPSNLDKKASKMQKSTEHVAKVSEHKRQELANQKRLDSLKQRKKEAETQKLMVQKALSKVDKADGNKKVVFDSDDEDIAAVADDCADMGSASSSEEEQGNLPSTALKHIPQKLFENESDSDDVGETDNDVDRFNIRPEYEGTAGKKLLKLQSRFGNDTRFKLDARFMESGSEDEAEVKAKEVFEEHHKAGASEQERALEILRGVVGSGALLKKKKESKTNFRDMSSLHYDPTKEDHLKFEIQDEPKIKKTKKKKLEKKSELQPDAQRDSEVPEVSSERFYEVTAPLKEVFSKDGDKEHDDRPTESGFSLLAMFGGEQEPEEKHTQVEEESRGTKIKSLFPWQENLDYGDSSEEEELREREHSDRPGGDGEIDTCTSEGLEGTRQETFFFCENDPRIKEGIAFFHCTVDKEKTREKWLEKRPFLVDAYRLRRKRTLRQTRTDQKHFQSKRGRRR